MPPRLLAIFAVPAATGLLAVGLAVPAAAAQGGPRLSAVLTLAGHSGDRARLHRLAGQRPSPARLKALAPAPAHRDAALRFARQRHLDVVRADAWTVTVSGPAAALSAAFGASLHRSSAGTWAVHPAVPASLGRDVTSVVGLDSRRFHRSHATLDGADNPQTAASLRAAYDVPSGWRGAGVTVGVLNLAGWNPNDLTTFAQHEGIPVSPNQIKEVAVGADPHELDGYGGEGEVALDAEAVLGAAPEAKQRLYFAPNTSAGVVSVLQQMASDAEAGLLQVVTTSWGSCEKFSNATDSAAEREAYAAAIDRVVAAGATLFAASGDAGAYDCSYPDQTDDEAQVDFPASYVNTVGVGGTTLTAGQSETAWYDLGFGEYLGDGSGGGESTDQPLPAFQAGLVPGATRRMVPDVAADADPQSGMSIYIQSQGGWQPVGGTSLASPTWAGMLAAALSSAGRTTGLGNILPALYASAADSVTPGLADITSGHNGLFQAGTGYDQVTGLGVPRWSRLGPDLLAAAASAPTTGTPSPVTRPARSAAPRLAATSHYTRSRTVPVSVVVSRGSSYSGFAVGETVPACAQQQASPPTTATLDAQPWQGEHELLLTALDSARVCHVVATSVVYDTERPSMSLSAVMADSRSTRVRLLLHGKDDTSGVDSYQVWIRDAAGRLVWQTRTTQREPVVGFGAGRTYRVEVAVRDRAGNVAATVSKVVTLPRDDTAFRVSSGWARVGRSLDFGGSHLLSQRRGSSATVVVNARQVLLLLLRGPSSGLVDVYVDGRRTARWDLYSRTTSALRVPAATWSRAGRHTVQFVVTGTHRPGSRGSYVVLDGVLVLP